jgi:hypothetical protein
MTLNEYIAKLQQFIVANPDAAQFTVVASGDDEGNSYYKIYYDPSVGRYDGSEWHTEGELDHDEFKEEPKPTLNAVCVN